MATDWKWKVFLFVRAADATTANKRKFADIYVDNGSLETVTNELKMFDSVVRLSTTGEEPAQAFGINCPAKTSMRDGFRALLDELTDARYAVVANTKLPNFEDGELVLTNFPVTPNGQIVTWDDALAYLESEFGLLVIPPDETV